MLASAFMGSTLSGLIPLPVEAEGCGKLLEDALKGVAEAAGVEDMDLTGC